MSMTKTAWIISTMTHNVVQRNGPLFSYNVLPTERNGFTNTKAAKEILYRARKMLHDKTLTIVLY